MWLATALATMAASTAEAHPHMFLDATVKAVMVAGQIRHFEVTWTYDLDISLMLLEDFDKDRDGKFSERELVKLRKEVFDPGAEFGYYLQVQSGDKLSWLTSIDSFAAEIAAGRVRLSFASPVPAGLAADPRKGEITLALWDEDMMVALMPPANAPVSFTGEGAAGCSAKQVLERAVPWPDGLYKLYRIDITCQ